MDGGALLECGLCPATAVAHQSHRRSDPSLHRRGVAWAAGSREALAFLEEGGFVLVLY